MTMDRTDNPDRTPAPTSAQFVANARERLDEGNIEGAIHLLVRARDLQTPQLEPTYKVLAEITRLLGTLGTWEQPVLTRIEGEMQKIIDGEMTASQDAVEDEGYAEAAQYAANARAAQRALETVQLCAQAQATFKSVHGAQIRGVVGDLSGMTLESAQMLEVAANAVAKASGEE